jgi:2-oxo-4-hydroxy-4-carboxy--5-ureidoimidazoline (OHCU) decarboxylase
LMKQAQENEDKEFTETTIEDQTAGVLDKLTPEQRAKIAGLNNTENP